MLCFNVLVLSVPPGNRGTVGIYLFQIVPQDLSGDMEDVGNRILIGGGICGGNISQDLRTSSAQGLVT